MKASQPSCLASLKDYHQQTRGALTGFLMGLPLTIGYALAVTLSPISADARDFLIRLQIELFGEGAFKGIQLAVVATFVVAVVVLWRRGRFHPGYFGPLVVEAMVYAALAVILVHLASVLWHLKPPFAPLKPGYEPVVSALGEAVNEETLFRWVLLELLLWLLAKFAQLPAWLSRVLAVLVSATVYAAVGIFWTPLPSNDLVPLAARAFTLGVAGLFFGTLYLVRGYPACAYTHVFYATFWSGVAPHIRLG